MTMVSPDRPQRGPAQPAAEPCYFRSGDNTLFGWLHRPAAPSDLGVVICNAFGYEAICSHRSTRRFAEALASVGIAVLRFDYAGTGDSSDTDENRDQVPVWTADAAAAAAALRACAGVRRVGLVGIRLGALLASLAVRDGLDADFLVLIGPVISGRRYARELRMTQLAGLALAGGAEGAEHEPSERGSPRLLEAGGFVLSPATLATLASVDLAASDAPPVRAMLLLDSDKLPTAKRWAERLRQSRVSVSYRALPGLIEMTMTAPQFAAVPTQMLEATCAWVNEQRDPAEPTDAGSTRIMAPGTGAAQDRPSGDLTRTLTLAGLDEPGAPITEEPAFISADVRLFGVVTAPPPAEQRRRAVLLLNPGADFHIGASRMYVSLARRWARRGYFVLRLDLGGIGDSETRRDRLEDEVFPDEAIDDIRAGIDYMRRTYGCGDVTLAGLCSGAYHALRAAAAGLPVDRILMVNPQNYYWKKGMSLEQVQLVEVLHNPGLYKQRVFSGTAWRRVFTGQTDVKRIGVIYTQRMMLTVGTALRNLARRLHVRLGNDLGWELEEIVARGVRVTFLFARGEPGIELLELQAGAALRRLGDRCRVRVVDSGDHIFSRREPRAIMERVLSEELFASADRPSGSAAPRGGAALAQAPVD